MGPVTRYATVEVQVDKVAQIFATLDPMPFRERDLDREAEEFIVDSARELPQGIPIRIVVHLPASEIDSEHARDLGNAVNAYFQYRTNAATGDIKELFRTGRYTLVVGLGVLAICIISGRLLIAALPTGHFGDILNEGLVILGWVANWRPIEIFLYEWWPIARRRKLYHRLASAEIVLSPPAKSGSGTDLKAS